MFHDLKGGKVTEFEEFGIGGPIGLIATTVAKTMRAEGLDGDSADEIARRIGWAVVGEFGGQSWFVPLEDGRQKSDPPLIVFVAAALEKAIAGRLSNAREVAERCATQCRKMIGGDYMYVMRCSTAKRQSRDQQIWRAFDGANFRALSKQFDLSEMRIRQIIARERERRAQGRGK